MVASTKYKFRKHDTVGNPSAEADAKFLDRCFVDNGELALLRDCAEQRSIVIGRTGSGKTALLNRLLACEERAIALEPQNLALDFISNSTIIQFFEALNVKMDLFYRFLWRHVFVVAVLKRHLGTENEDDTANWFDRLSLRLQGKKAYLDAFEYLKEFGRDFWKTTEIHLERLTKRVEADLVASLDIGINELVSLGAEGARRLTEEQCYRLEKRGQEVVNRTQMAKLSLLFDALDKKILTKEQQRYFIMVDRLDEDWVDDPMRYRLIRALIETMRDFNRDVTQAKVVIALRTDLFDRVLKATTNAGFQDEKYRGLCLPITWTRECLGEMLDERINELVRHAYTGQRVGYRDVIPPTVGSNREKSIDYLLDRTLLRPRDVIAFFNACISQAEGQTKVSPQNIQNAEGPYSQERLRSLCDEWSVHYPCLSLITTLLKKRPSSFRLGDIQEGELDDLCLTMLELDKRQSGEDIDRFLAYSEKKIAAANLKTSIARILYRVGIVGLKTEPFRPVVWSYNGLEDVSSAEITDNTSMVVHKMFWRVLGISSSA